MTFLFINKTLSPNNLQIRTVINAKISVFVVCVEAIVYLLLYKLHGCTFNVYIYFTGIFFVVFHLKTLFLLFSLFFWLNIKFRKQNINQSETRIGDENCQGKCILNTLPRTLTVHLLIKLTDVLEIVLFTGTWAYSLLALGEEL